MKICCCRASDVGAFALPLHFVISFSVRRTARTFTYRPNLFFDVSFFRFGSDVLHWTDGSVTISLFRAFRSQNDGERSIAPERIIFSSHCRFSTTAKQKISIFFFSFFWRETFPPPVRKKFRANRLHVP